MTPPERWLYYRILPSDLVETTVSCSLVVHGGAWNIPDESVEPAREGVRNALERGWEALRGGAGALDVVESVVRLLEDDPHFDAGRGSRLNRVGRVEMDASIMDGEHLDGGAVAAIQRVRHPISVARLVMERSPHVMLVGEGAYIFAEESDAELCRTQDLLTGTELERFHRVRAGELHLVEGEFGGTGARRRGAAASTEGAGGVSAEADDGPMGTVGAVALDVRGTIAAGTSTGGTQDKLSGRVGDTPVIGAGTYADNRFGGASATGWGEGIMRVLLTKGAVDFLATELHPREAARMALETLDRVEGKGGLIMLDRRGRVAIVFNTPRMARGWATAEAGPQVAVLADEPSP
jgi:beta-aspartyl-peptidase (threonine type)